MSGKGGEEPIHAPPSTSSVPQPLPPTLVPLTLSCVSLAIVFWGFWQSDPALILFLRTVHRFWLAQAGDMVNHLGDGLVLVLISGALLLVGLVFKRPPWRDAGVWSLMAHGAAGIAVQSLKRLIGRPRPRFMHGEDVHLAPSLILRRGGRPGKILSSLGVGVLWTCRARRGQPRRAWIALCHGCGRGGGARADRRFGHRKPARVPMAVIERGTDQARSLCGRRVCSGLDHDPS